MSRMADEPRNEAGEVDAAEAGEVDLAAEVKEMRQELKRTQVRQRALIRALASVMMLASSEMESLLVD